MSPYSRLVFLVIPVVMVAAACDAVAPPVPDDDPAGLAPRTVEEAEGVREIVGREQIPLSQDGFARRAERLTLRVRNLSCDGVASGSGFALTDRLLGTNRHVIAGADLLEVNTWDGRTLTVTAASAHVLGDLALLEVDDDLPQTTEQGAPATEGDRVTAVGHPLGGKSTLSRGRVVDRIAGTDLGIPEDVIRFTAELKPGNSGGPLLNEAGELVGIVFAMERETGFGLAIPLDNAQELLEEGGLEDVPPCGSS